MRALIYTADLTALRMQDIDQVGGKNASLGEMMYYLSSASVKVPCGFATTAEAFREFLQQNGLDKKIHSLMTGLVHGDLRQLTETGKTIRDWILNTPYTSDFETAIKKAYQALEQKIGHANYSLAVRSSATAEDLPEASFAGQQETFLNIHGVESVLMTIKQVFASLYNDRAISYRLDHGFDHHDVAISVGVQQMVRSDLAASGVLFTLDTESGFDQVVFITASYGLGEMVVQGAVNPDEFYVHKPALLSGNKAILRRNLGTKENKMIFNEDKSAQGAFTIKTVAVEAAEQMQFSINNSEVETLASLALTIEKHYGRPMDIEWAKDGLDGQIYILQARPETVKSRSNQQLLERYILQGRGTILTEGRSIGQKIGSGRAKIIRDVSEIHRIQPGDVLISDMTDPDWEPVMKRAAAIVTDRGGRTCHAAIIARELGIPAIVGCGDATKTIGDDTDITVSCAEGDIGFVYEGIHPFIKHSLNIDKLPELPVKVMLNVGNPEKAFAFQAVPNAGVGLARLEFLISNTIGIHPRALLEFDKLQDPVLKQKILKKIAAYDSPVEFYVEKLKEGIATIAAAFYPKPVIVRLSDFKSNEYANLLGGEHYEPKEENPMIGFRGASRYISKNFRACFELECKALRRAREEMGLTNIEIMVPFVRTLQEAQKVVEILKEQGLERGKQGLRLIMMCELPSNALLADAFLAWFDGFSIGSNDLTQLTLGIDRDSALVAEQFDERNDAVKALLHLAIAACKRQGKYVGICGQGPSDHEDLALWLMQEGIDSLSLNPDSVLDTCLFLADSNVRT